MRAEVVEAQVQPSFAALLINNNSTPGVTGIDSTVLATAADGFGNIYLAGSTAPDLPTKNANQPTCAGPACAGSVGFIAKFAPSMPAESQLVYLTYVFPSGSQNGQGRQSNTAISSIGIDGSDLYFGGFTDSDGLPTTTNAYLPSCPKCAEDPSGSGYNFGTFVGRLTSSGSLTFLTYVASLTSGTGREFDFDAGGTVGAVVSVAPAGNGHLFVTHVDQTGDAPVTPDAFLPHCRAGLGGSQSVPCTSESLLAEFDTNASTGPAALLYGSFVGNDFPQSSVALAKTERIAIGPSGDVILAGTTQDTGFPVTANAAITAPCSETDSSAEGCGFVMEINPEMSGSSALVYSTLLSNTGGFVYTSSARAPAIQAVGIDNSGDLFVGGNADAAFLPTGRGQAPCSTDGSPFFEEINPAVSGASGVVFASYYCHSTVDTSSSFAFAPGGTVLVTGQTTSPAFLANNSDAITGSSGCVPPLNKPTEPEGLAAFISVLDPSAEQFVDFSACLSGTDTTGNANTPPENITVGQAVATDSKGNIYLAGYTQDPSLLGLSNPSRRANSGILLANPALFVVVLPPANSGGTNPPPPPTVALTHPSNVSFGTVKVGAEKSKAVKFKNPGKTPLTIPSSALSISASEFTVTDGCSGRTLPKKGNCSVQVTFQASQAGFASGTVTLAGNTVSLGGTGKAPKIKK